MKCHLRAAGTIVAVAAVIFTSAAGFSIWYFDGMRNLQAYLRGELVVVYPTKIDFGGIAPGGRATCSVLMTNVTSQTARILGANTTCDFRVDEALPFEIPPHSSRAITLTSFVPACENGLHYIYLFYVQGAASPLQVEICGRSPSASGESPNAAP